MNFLYTFLIHFKFYLYMIVLQNTSYQTDIDNIHNLSCVSALHDWLWLLFKYSQVFCLTSKPFCIIFSKSTSPSSNHWQSLNAGDTDLVRVQRLPSDTTVYHCLPILCVHTQDTIMSVYIKCTLDLFIAGIGSHAQVNAAALTKDWNIHPLMV